MQQSTDVQRMPIAIAMPMIAAAEERALEAEAALRLAAAGADVCERCRACARQAGTHVKAAEGAA